LFAGFACKQGDKYYKEEKDMGRLVKGLALSAVMSSVVMAGGYKLPEQSVNSMGLAAAYVAHTMGADTAYYNPANMVFMEDKNFIEGGLTLAHLPANVYTLGGPASGKSKVENLVIPNMHYVAPAMGDFRWGVSLVVPGGLTKRWESAFQKATAEEFTLKVIELNPSIAYKVSDNFAVAAGVRIIYSEGIVKSDSSETGGPLVAKRNMEGDTIEFGYNLALTYKPTSDINFAVTYRSNVNLKEEGTAKLFVNAINPTKDFYNDDASVEVPLPATLNIAISKTWNNQFTLEFDYERAFWSEYKSLDFQYKTALPAFDAPIARNWKDVNIYRVGATVKIDEKLTALFGFSIDNSPVPVETIGFELPDSDSKNFSMGFKYKQSENLSWGAAFLYSSKEAITLKAGGHEDQSPRNLLNRGGGFSEGGAFLTTVGVAYEF
jgi:long-chain fatty acid transport protein